MTPSLQTRPRGRSLAAALATVALLAAGPPVAEAETVVGLAVSEMGPMGERSQAMRAAVEAAVAALNSAGGVLGEPVKLVVADDHCSDAGAAAAARTLASAQARLVVGHPCEKAALAAASAYAANGILFIAPATRHPALTDKRAGKTIFRLAGREDRQGEAAGHWLADEAKSGRVAIVQDRTAYARGLTAGATAVLKARGIATPAIFPIVASEKSYAPVIAGIAAGNIEAVYFAGYPAEALIILEGLKKAGLQPKFLGCDALAGSEFASAAIAQTSNVALMLRPDARPHPAEPALPIANAANAATPSAPPQQDRAAANSATAIRIWAETAARMKSVDAATLAAELQTATFTDMPSPASGQPARDRTASDKPTSDNSTSHQGVATLSFDEKGDARIPGFRPAHWTGRSWAIGGTAAAP